ncbi:hypothetical protein AGMMS50256_08630 [Betaproteobacteria bacterium]|nr:hypothetical protein AGMMS50256_08630 [Betaproteobacteria bacterium]
MSKKLNENIKTAQPVQDMETYSRAHLGSMWKTSKGRVYVATAISVVAAVVIGCGGGGGDDNSQPTPPTDKDNTAIPYNANTTDPSAPFYVDITGLDFSIPTQPPTRTATASSYPTTATTLATGQLPPLSATGNFLVNGSRNDAPEATVQSNVPTGTVVRFTMASADSTIYNPGIVRDDDPDVRNSTLFVAQPAPGDPSNMILIDPANPHPGPWTRMVTVYIPAGYVAGSEAPFMVVGDGGLWSGMTKIHTMLDNLIFQKRIPPIIFIEIGNGGGDAQGSQRGREYDTVDGTYAEFVEQEVLPLVEQNAAVKLTHDPEGRATMGLSSSAAASVSMAWFHPEWYHRVLAYSPTMVNQQWPHNPALPGGAWQFHSPWAGTKAGDTPNTPLFLSQPKKPIRIWFANGDQDNFYPAGYMADGMHDWVLGTHNFAKVLATQGYEYMWMFALDGPHFDVPLINQTLPYALEWVWQGYPVTP